MAAANNLVGIHTPVQLQPALLNFFQKAQINLSDGNITINLMDYFPLLKQGYATKSVLQTMELIYARNNGLNIDAQNLVSDQLMNESFGGNIPAHYFNYRDPNGRIRKILMSEAVNSELIPNYLNTYQVLQSLYPPGTLHNGKPVDFNPNHMKHYYLQHINALNYEKVPQTLDQDFLDELNAEYELADEIGRIHYEIVRLIKRGINLDINDPYTFIEQAAIKGTRILLQILLEQPGLNQLYISILYGNVDEVIRNLQIYDPRSDNFRAYRMAKNFSDRFSPNDPYGTNYRTIADLIRQNSIQRNLLQQRAFTNILGTQVPSTNLPSTIANYAQQYTQGRI